MKNFLSPLAAVGLVVLWLATLFVFPRIRLLLPNSPVQLTLPTLITLSLSQRFGQVLLPPLVLATALLIGLRQFVVWVCALALCIVWDLAFLGLLTFVTDNINKGYIAGLAFFLAPAVALVAFALLLNQVLCVLLLVKRREFAR